MPHWPIVLLLLAMMGAGAWLVQPTPVPVPVVAAPAAPRITCDRRIMLKWYVSVEPALPAMMCTCYATPEGMTGGECISPEEYLLRTLMDQQPRTWL